MGVCMGVCVCVCVFRRASLRDGGYNTVNTHIQHHVPSQTIGIANDPDGDVPDTGDDYLELFGQSVRYLRPSRYPSMINVDSLH